MTTSRCMGRASWAAGALLASSACGPDGEAVVETPAAIVSGEIDLRHPEVVAIGFRRSHCGDRLSSFCTGTLIAPDVVLTAAHCFADNRPGTVYEVAFGADAQSPTEGRYVQALALHPEFDAASHRADLALLRLASPVFIAPAVAGPGAVSPDTKVEVVGFGSDGSTETGAVRRRGWARISTLGEETFQILADPAMTCHGDSGGPAFVTTNSTSKLVGVTSWGDPGCNQFGVETRLEPFWDGFIAPFLTDSAPSSPPRPAHPDLCSASCDDSNQCPDGFECAASGGSRRCLAGSPDWGNYTQACTRDSDCGSSTCGRVAAGGVADACRCFVPCASAPRASRDLRPVPDSGAGCAVGGATSHAVDHSWLWMGGVWLARRPGRSPRPHPGRNKARP